MSGIAPRLATRSAHWGYDEHQYFGSAVFEELRGRESFSGLIALSVLGRRLPQEICSLLDDAAVCLTMADPRIWPLKLTRVIACYGHAMPAVAAGLLIQEQARIGPWAMQKAAETLVELHAALGDRAFGSADARSILLSFVRSAPFVWGFGTPFRQRDERLVAFRKSIEERGCDRQRYFRIFEALAEVVRAERHAPPNMAMALAAVLLDQGLTPDEIGPMTVALMQHMFFAHGVEGAQQAPACLRQLPSELVHYTGREPRLSPRAEAQAQKPAR